MLKKPFRILTMMLLMWAVTLLTVIKNSRYLVYNEQNVFENALDKFRKKYTSSNKESKFEAWKQLDPYNIYKWNKSGDERMAVIKGNDFPPGMDGRPVHLADNLRGTIRMLAKKGWTDHAFNQLASDLIPVTRTLPDARFPGCKTQKYLKLLPPTSVVICFYNEAWSTLIRTVQSALRNSPAHLVNEILLYDDHSTMRHLGTDLDNYVKKLSKVTLLRGSKREGLIRARVNAAKQAKSPVIVFLDSHCECTKGWLEPLLDRLGRDKRKIVCPVIDHIHDNTFEFIPQNINNLRIGGFTWDLKFAWKSIPREQQAKRNGTISPVRTPTISGGIFAISKVFFEELGYYDEGFELWGGENLELSFKAWMCAGSMEMVPCSHVGHVFRNRFPYDVKKEYFMRNNMRLAQVWLDRYAKYFYERIGNQELNYGNISSRVQLRKKLKCKSFEWYLKNVYVDMELPDSYVASGQIYTLIKDKIFCLDAAISQQSYTGNVRLLSCHHTGGNQFWVYTRDGQIKRDNYCLEYSLKKLNIYLCRDRARSQIWLYDQKSFYIKFKETHKCLKYIVKQSSQQRAYELVLDNCKNTTSEKWVMEKFNIKKLAPALQVDGVRPYIMCNKDIKKIVARYGDKRIHH